jgi:DNA repair protein RecO (recombination protein O)
MIECATPAIILRRRAYGDQDLIVALLTPEDRKVSAMARSARKSLRRFSGSLEPFSAANVVYKMGKGLPVLTEAVLHRPFMNIRSDTSRSAYACYWIELTDEWLEEGTGQTGVYDLLDHVLSALDAGQIPNAVLNVVFQMKFMTLAGFSPHLDSCVRCGKSVDDIEQHRMVFDLSRGGLICQGCGPQLPRHFIWLSKGTIKPLSWMAEKDLNTAQRIRITRALLRESTSFMEMFVTYHLEKTPKSLGFLKEMVEG